MVFERSRVFLQRAHCVEQALSWLNAAVIATVQAPPKPANTTRARYNHVTQPCMRTQDLKESPLGITSVP